MGVPQIGEFANEVWETSKLGGIDLSRCSELGCLPDSIVDLSQLKTFQLWGCRKLENLLIKFGKLQSLVELELFGCSKLGCLLDLIVDL